MTAPASATPGAPGAAMKKRGLRMKTVSTCTIVLALSCVFAFPSMRDQLTARGASAPKISRTAHHIKGSAHIPWAASKT